MNVFSKKWWKQSLIGNKREITFNMAVFKCKNCNRIIVNPGMTRIDAQKNILCNCDNPGVRIEIVNKTRII